MTKRTLTILLFLASIVSTSFAQTKDFSKPWTFWYWMYGEVNNDAIEYELREMKKAGIGGFYLMPIKGKSDIPKDANGQPLYKGDAEQLTEKWWSAIDRVYSVSEKLGLEMGIHISDGFALAGGPWIKPEESMKRVVYCDTIITADKKTKSVSTRMPEAKEGFYRDIAVLAYPAKYSDRQTPKSSVEFPFRSSEPADIIMSYGEPFTLRSVKVVTGGNNYQAHRLALYASDNGADYRFVQNIEPARQGWQNTDAQATYSVKATTARFFKFHWTPEGSNPGAEDMDAAKWKPNLKIGNLILSSEPVIDGFEGKSGVVWRVSKAVDADKENECLARNEIIDLTPYTKNGRIDFSLIKKKALKKLFKKPKDWHIVRLGYTSTGHRNATGGGGKGLECDKFSRVAVQKQVDNWFMNIYNRQTESQKGNVVTRLHVDSWECGSQNWSENFADEFKKRRGYNLNDWLLLYAGVPVESVKKSDEVLRDIRNTIGELVNEVFFSVARETADRQNLDLSTECVAPTMVSDGLLHYNKADIPMGEFWLNSPTHDKINDMLDAISGAHIYGKNIIQAEGFTEVRGTWDEHPAMLKQLLDRNFCYGINSIVFHVMTHNPYMDKLPGMTLDGIGTFFQPSNTWWKQMPSFTSYISDCQTLLQHGKPVVDIAVYTGDEMPRRSIIPNRLADILPGLFGPEYLAQEYARMRNEGQPMEVSPVGVSHTKNMVKADNFINPLHGYKYDSFNHDVLKTATVVNGKIRTAYGMEYSVLVIPQTRPMNPNGINTAAEDIARLKSLGAKIIEQPWMQPDLSSLGVEPDIQLPEGLDYAHRKADNRDSYFISNQSDKTVGFRIKDLKIRDCNRRQAYSCTFQPKKLYRINDLMRNTEIRLAPGDSYFLVFTDERIGDIPEFALKETREIQDISNNTWKLNFAKNGMRDTTDVLKDWTEYDNPQIKYYSGTCTYTTRLNSRELDEVLKSIRYKASKRVCISFENVNNIVSVKVNGIYCGTAWRAPYKIDITDVLHKGNNDLEIQVTNTWANALLGSDLGTPPFENIWTNGKYRRAEKEPLPAGMTGAVKIILE